MNAGHASPATASTRKRTSTLDLARARLASQRLIGAPLATPEAVVGRFGAVQAQDYAGARWAIGQRARNCSEADVEAALQSGRILRTHVLRPTWHFVLPADIRWLLALSAPRVRAAMAYHDRQLELDAATVRRSHAAIARALRGGEHLTRAELQQVLARAGIRAAGQRLGQLMMRAELDALICSGSRRGKPFTYALLDERAPPAATLQRDEALAELACRYFTSHGPATVHDFAWWSGLTVTDAKRAVQAAGAALGQEVANEKTYWLAPPGAAPRRKSATVHLLPIYDEHVVAYRDHAPSLDRALVARIGRRRGALDNHVVVRDGLVIGGWRRTLAKGAVEIDTRLARKLDRAEARALQAAADRYGRFLGMDARLSVQAPRE